MTTEAPMPSPTPAATSMLNSLVSDSFLEQDYDPDPRAASSGRKIHTVDVQLAIGAVLHSEYLKFLGNFYLKAGFTRSETCRFLDILVHGEPSPLPYFVLPMRGGSLGWARATAEGLGTSLNGLVTFCLSNHHTIAPISKYVGFLQSHVRRLQGRAASVRETIAVGLADVLVKLPKLDDLLLVPDLDLGGSIGEFKSIKSNRALPDADLSRERVLANLNGKQARELCARAGWTLRGIRIEGEKCLQAVRPLVDSGTLLGGETVDSAFRMGVENLLYTLKLAENNLIELNKAISSIERVGAVYVAALSRMAVMLVKDG